MPQRAELLRNRIRGAAFRVSAECERLLDELERGGHATWRDALTQLRTQAKQLGAITAPRAEGGQTTSFADDARVIDTQRGMLSTLDALAMKIAVTQGNDLVLQDVRAMRDVVGAMLEMPMPDAAKHKQAAVTVTSDAAGAAAQRKFRVLIVDDDESILEGLQWRLEDMGYDVVSAGNGADGLGIAEQGGIDLLISDIEMPEMDGITLLGMIKGRQDLRDIPVIVVSGKDDLESVTKCIELGAEDHISKPYDATILRARVVASLERKRLRDIDTDRLRRVGVLTAAAEAVEQESYTPGFLASLIARRDEIGKLARVFDRMVTGLRSRAERLDRRQQQLRNEMAHVGYTMTPDAQKSRESPFATDQVVLDRYKIGGELGRGGMGMVYRATDKKLGEQVALKVVRGDLLKEDPKLAERLKDEIKLARKISHKNVVRVHDFGEADGTMFISMEYVAGITVGSLLDRRGRLTVESTLSIGTQLCEALAVAHGEHVIHRDIKPSNLLLDADGVLKVMDFGIARSVARDAGTKGAGRIVGTPRYMSPEQTTGHDIDARSDLFAVGIVLYECLTGNVPFKADTPIGIFAEVLDGNVVPLTTVAPEVPAKLADLIHKQLKFEPKDRSASAREIADRLAEIELSF
jgi:CheY-like chemotaxis protein/RIO-like serine/threonine protein kinase